MAESEERDPWITGLRVSGAAHGLLILLVAVGTDWLAPAEPVPLSVTEVSLVEGARFDAAVSAAPAPAQDAPEGLVPAAEDAAPPEGAPEATPDRAGAPAPPADGRPGDAPVVAAPPAPTPVPSAAARPSIAEVPSPEQLPDQASEPESPPATEVVQPLASAEAPLPGARPRRPPDPEPAPEADAEPEPEPEPRDPDPEATAETGLEAPVSPAPQMAALPVAREAERAAAARASRETRRAEATPEPEPVPERSADAAEQTEPDPPGAAEPAEADPAPAEAAPARFAAQVTRGERDALRLGLKQYFTYRGRVSDPALAVRVGITLNRSGRITEGPELIEARGGTEPERRILFRDARTALILAMQAGVFAKLPAAKYEAWRRIHVTFTPDEIGFQS